MRRPVDLPRPPRPQLAGNDAAAGLTAAGGRLHLRTGRPRLATPPAHAGGALRRPDRGGLLDTGRWIGRRRGSAGRAFVREACGRREVQELADPAALLASELISLAVAHAGRRWSRGSSRRPPAACGGQGPGPGPAGLAGRRGGVRPQAEPAGRGRGRHGVRQDPAGGKVACGALEPPAPEAEVVGADEDPTQAMGLPGSGLVASKLRTPVPRPGRSGLPASSRCWGPAWRRSSAGSRRRRLREDHLAGDLAGWSRWGPGGLGPLDQGDKSPRACGSMRWRCCAPSSRAWPARTGSRAPEDDRYRVGPPELLDELSRVGSPLVLASTTTT